MKHFSDCPTNRGYNICTCDMCGEEIALVEWTIQKQENKMPWYNIIGRLSTIGAPTIDKLPIPSNT